MNNMIIIDLIMTELKDELSKNTYELVRATLIKNLFDKDIVERVSYKPDSNEKALNTFIKAKKIEGCSLRSLEYYKNTIKILFQYVDKAYDQMTTEDLRTFLALYKDKNQISRGTIDNIRRIVSSFFSWLEQEDFIVKSPCRRIRKIKQIKVIKETYSEETIELLRQGAKNIRDLAIINFLYTTGVRVGELVRIKKSDIDFENKECIVLGKGNKQRKVYFDAKTKINLIQYLSSRNDNNEYLFVSLLKPHNRLQISGVEIMLRKLGKELGLEKVHPHKFRRTLATKAIDKGMPIEQVQHLLGHSKIDTTLGYAMVDDSNVKNAHKKYLE